MFTKTITADEITWTNGVATLVAHTTGLILNVEVDEAHRGEGQARAIFEHANQEIELLHIPAWGRTWEGNEFAEAMGGDTMDDETAAAIVGMDLALLELA